MSSATTYSASPSRSNNAPSALHTLLFIVGFILGKLFKLLSILIQGNVSSVPLPAVASSRVKPDRSFQPPKDQERTPAMTRRSGVRLSDWYAQNVVDVSQRSTTTPAPETPPPPEVPSAESSNSDETPFGMETDMSVNEEDERMDAIWNT